MKLPIPALDITTQLLEFDVWITPSLGEIRDTERFRQELDTMAMIFDVMGAATNNFENLQDCTPTSLAEILVELASHKAHLQEEEPGTNKKNVQKLFESLASVLFLVSGKSDNNAKCQIPIYLRKRGWETIPTVRSGRNGTSLSQIPLPRTIEAEKYMSWVTNLSFVRPNNTLGLFEQKSDLDVAKDQQRRMLEEFIGFILSDDSYVSQLWSIGHSYFLLKPYQREKNLLSPLVMFQVRGSVSASGGHGPEEILRNILLEWGLQAAIDFDLNDVIVAKEDGIVPVEAEEPQNIEMPAKEKTRAYDFVLPFKTPDWKPGLFIQSQFYAGDSGSVSHKNVDQTGKSRAHVQELIGNAKFIEYVDGAGYYSSLNGDLKKLLQMATTKTFIQVKSAVIRLRREYQAIGLLLPIELEHAILRTNGLKYQVYQLLRQEEYDSSEIDRCLQDCLDRNFVEVHVDQLAIKPERRAIVRRYFLLDIAACYGITPGITDPPLIGSLLVSGYGPIHGIKLDELIKKALELAPKLREDWSSPEVQMEDIKDLCERGFAISR